LIEADNQRGGQMPDALFEDPRLAVLYDVFDDDRSDLVVYVDLADQLGAAIVLDIGCGTGTFALMLADRGVTVIGVDPAVASLDVARAKPGADRVTWIHGDARALPRRRVDLVTMTGNVAQAVTDPAGWAATLQGAHDVLKPDGYLVLETRDPAFQAWTEWTREATYRIVDVAGIGPVEHWTDVTDVAGPLVTFRGHWYFHETGSLLLSDSTLLFRNRAEVGSDLAHHGFTVTDVRDAPDRPGREFVFIARRSGAVAANQDLSDHGRDLTS
jgi:SAM-dependent methyltransferase